MLGLSGSLEDVDIARRDCGEHLEDVDIARRDCGEHLEGELVGIGVGPGDPEQVTLAALREVRAADHVLAPSSSRQSVGRAESVLRQACPEVRIERVAVDMSTSEGTEATYLPIVERVIAWLECGETVAFATIGDPCLYSTFTSVAELTLRLRPGTRMRTVPGITAFQLLASTAGTVLASGSEAVTVLTALDDMGELRAALGDPNRAVVVYKGGGRFPEIAKVASEVGRLEGAVAGELLGLPGMRIAPLADVASEPCAYLSTVIFPPVRASNGEVVRASNGEVVRASRGGFS
jgi:precorrin-2/cobalt-factor-2 C20-methyltransferase